MLVPLVAVLVVVAVAAGVLGVGMVRRSLPQTAGELTVSGLTSDVQVLRDERGVAHIYADTAEDLFAAQGYVAAQDRFFQMDLRRHVTAGRLSELVGEGGLESDRVVRTMGWRRVAQEELPRLSPDARRYLQAYSMGVNAYLEDNPEPSQTSLEYVLLSQWVPDYRIEPWTELDSLTWLKAMAWDLRGNYTDELARARLAGRVPLPQLDSLYPSYPYGLNPPILSDDEWRPPPAEDLTSQDRGSADDATTQNGGSAEGTTENDGSGDDPAPQDRGGDADVVEEVEPGPNLPGSLPHQNQVAGAYDGALAALAAVPPMVGRGEGVGSNAWVVSGEHTASGLPLLANDPHLDVTQPGVWLQAGLHCRQVGPECPFDVTGFTFAGFPGVIIGHNADIAWGFTNLDPDVTDFYLEEVRGETYRRGLTWVPLEQRQEVIKVGGGDDVALTVRSTAHGPILSDVIEEVAAAGEGAPVNGIERSSDYDVSMAWTGLEPSRTAEAVFALNAATDWESFRSAAQLFAVPSQNIVYADTEGNIGYQAPGLVPVRESSTNGAPPGFWPSPGWISSHDWQGWVPFSEMPYAYNPADGIIVSANQAVAQSSTPFLTSEWDHGYRAQRIAALLAAAIAEGPLTVESMTDIQTDTHNPFADTLMPYLLDVELTGDFYREPQQLLSSWDRTAPADDSQLAAGAMYYYAVWAQLLALTFNDELPPDLYASGGSRWQTLVANLLERPDDPWWDDQRTVGVVESRDEILRQALIDARLDLTRGIGKDTATWSWGRLHRLPMRHQVLGSDALPDVVLGVFNEGPYPMPGSSNVVNANSWDAGTGSYQVSAGPSMRMVVDLSDLDDSRWVNQGGNSGHALHPHYGDQTAAWIAGQTYPWAFTEERVRAGEVQELRLVPQP